MRAVARPIGGFGLVLWAIYCIFALLCTAGGRDIGSVGGALFMWFGAIGGAIAVFGLLQRKPFGYQVGMAVYLAAFIGIVVLSAVSKLPATDRIFYVGMGALNGLGAWAL